MDKNVSLVTVSSSSTSLFPVSVVMFTSSLFGVFKGYDFHIPLQLHGIFSYFITQKPDVESLVGAHEPLNNATEIYTLTPMRWNPHMDAYAQNKDSIIDWEGNIKDNDKSNRDIKIVLEDVGDEYQNEYKVSSVEVKRVDEILKARTQQDNNNNWYRAHELSAISSVLCPHLLTLMIEEWLNLRSDAVNIGAMNGYDDKYLDKYDDALFDDITLTTKDTIEDAVKELGDEEDMDDFFASSVHGGSKVGIDAKHLSKEWLISYEDAKQTIDATTQHGTPLPNPAMNQNYTTND